LGPSFGLKYIFINYPNNFKVAKEKMTMSSIYQQQKIRTLTLFETALIIARQLDKREIEIDLQKALQNLNSGQLSVVVAGECKK
jgi:hypothetical protein